HQRRVRPGRRLDALVAWTLLTPSVQQELDLALAARLRTSRVALADYLAASAGDRDATDRLVERTAQLFDAGASDVAAATMALALAHQPAGAPSPHGPGSNGPSTNGSSRTTGNGYQATIPGTAQQAPHLARLLAADGYTVAARQQLRALARDGAHSRTEVLTLVAEMAAVSGDPTEAISWLDVERPPRHDLDAWLRAVLTICRIQVALDGPAQSAKLMAAIRPTLSGSAAETSALADLVAAEAEVYAEAPGSIRQLRHAVDVWTVQRTPPSAAGPRSTSVDLSLAAGAVDLLGLGHISAARELLSSAGVQQMPFATARVGVLTLRTEAEIAAGHYRRAAASLLDNDRERPGPSVADLMVTSQAIRIGAACGDLPECQTIEDRLGRSTSVVLTYPARRAHTAALGFRELVAGHYERSRDLLTLALQGPALQLQGRSCVLADLVEATAATGDRVAAAEALDRHSGWLPDAEGERSAGLLARCQALVAPPEQVDDRFAAAIEAHTTTHETDRARTWLAYGRTLLVLGRAVDARPAFNAAQELFRELRLCGWQEHVRRLYAQVLEPEATDDRAEIELSDVEQQILALVMQRKRNREIAATLFVSLRTVESHLTRIFRKLGVSTKSQLYRQHTSNDHSASDPHDYPHP
ncbi:MAG: helix-turn-helix transcriptional regulator, partial [Propionibacteriaceae bacterium]